MSALKNTRHERFAQELAKGKSQRQSYVIAGYKTHISNPSKLAKDKRIVARVAELGSERAKIDAMAVEKAAETLGIDKTWVMARLVENAERALQRVPMTNEDGSVVGYRYEGGVANRALELLGKEMGMFIDRKEVTRRVSLEELIMASYNRGGRSEEPVLIEARVEESEASK